MIRLTNLKEFFEQVGCLMFEDFDHLKIKPDTAIGFFNNARLQELKNFCKQNAQYHVVSQIKDSYFNIPIEHASFYYLGLGDNNPSLIYATKRTDAEITRSKILEFDIG